MANKPATGTAGAGGSLGSNLGGISGAASTGGSTSLIPDIKQFFYYGVAALSLIALAEYLPKAAIMLTLILIVGVLLNHWSDYTPYISGKF